MSWERMTGAGDCIDAVRGVFGGPVVGLQAEGNLVLLAFKDSPAAGTLHAIHARSDAVKQRFQLEFPAFLQALNDLGKHRLALPSTT